MNNSAKAKLNNSFFTSVNGKFKAVKNDRKCKR